MMKKSAHIIKVCFVFLLLAIMPCAARAGGIYLYEIGTPDLGLAGAGSAARAQDAATVYTNPAGMARLDRSQVLFGIQPLYMDLEFSPDERTTQSGSSGDAADWLPGGSFFYVQNITQDLKFGLGVFGHFGMALDYGNDWVGRYYVKDTTLQAMGIQPTLAYRINDHFSLGAGVIASYVIFEENVAINNLTGPDGELHLEDDPWAFQVNAGLLFELSKDTRFGLTYLSEGEIDLTSDLEFRDLGAGLNTILKNRGLLTGEIDLEMKMPQSVMFSVYHQLSDRLALMADAGWQNWEEFGKVDVGISSENLTTLKADMKYDDTYHVAFGAQYRAAPQWLLSVGAAYDSSCMEDENRSPSLPLGEAWRFAFGTQYQWSKDIDIGWAYELMWAGELDMDVNRGPLAGRLAGTYEDVALHFFNVNLSWKF
ncbi:MAG: OmpP1/FadL family transporter [Desulfococcaceae bacterium]